MRMLERFNVSYDLIIANCPGNFYSYSVLLFLKTVFLPKKTKRYRAQNEHGKQFSKSVIASAKSAFAVFTGRQIAALLLENTVEGLYA